MVEPPNELELNRAFTRKMNHLLCIIKAIHRFKALLAARRRRLGQDGAGSASNPPGISDDNFDPARAKAKAAEIEVVAEISRRRKLVKMEEKDNENENGGSKGHAHDVSDVEPLFLGIGTGSRDDFAMDEASPDVVADSPTAVDYNIYDRAYEEAVEERLRANSSHRPTLYLTRFVKEKEHFKKLEELVDNSSEVAPRILDRMRSSGQSIQHNVVDKSSASLTHLVSKLGITGAKDESSKPAS
jgi:[calcium/calmodulin-dependent protein kinase] kinase